MTWLPLFLSALVGGIYLLKLHVQRSWQIEEAKNKLNEIVQEAIENGPQILTRRGVEVAVILSLEEYLQLKKKQTSLSELFRQSPLADLDLKRDRSPARPEPEL